MWQGVCKRASGDEGDLLAFWRPLAHGAVRLTFGLETEALDLNLGAAPTQEETADCNSLNRSRERTGVSLRPRV